MLNFIGILDFVGIYRAWNFNFNYTVFMKIGNTFDILFINACVREKDKILGHLPMEISRMTKFLLNRRESETLKLTSTNYEICPLFQLILQTSHLYLKDYLLWFYYLFSNFLFPFCLIEEHM